MAYGHTHTHRHTRAHIQTDAHTHTHTHTKNGARGNGTHIKRVRMESSILSQALQTE